MRRFSMSIFQSFRPTVEERWWLLELLAWWEGGVNTRHLTQVFGIGRQQASKDLNAYVQAFPDQLIYDSRLKCYIPTPEFSPQYINGDVDQYLNHMHGFQRVPVHGGVSMEVLASPQREVSVKVIRALVSAIRTSQRLDVDYLSISNPNPEGRVLVPFHFVRTGVRWHLRAWCEKSQDYRDFVLSRFRGEPELMGAPITPLPVDVRWDTQITIVLKPDPRLSPAQQSVVMVDYGMTEGELHVSVRAALAHYLLRDMQIGYKMLDGIPSVQQVVVANFEDIRHWLP